MTTIDSGALAGDLAAGGANGADLYSMGELLGGIQHVAQATGTSLLICEEMAEDRALNITTVKRISPTGYRRVVASYMDGAEQPPADRVKED